MDEEFKKYSKDFFLSDKQLEEVYNRFNADINKGLGRATNNEADMKCFVTYVQDLPTGEETGQFLGLDLGGTNFRVLLVTLKGHHEANVDAKTYAVPKSIMTGPGEGLFDHIATCLSSFVEEQNLVDSHLPLGFTFSFPCTQLGLTKAILTRWTKGFNCSGVENEDVVRLLNEAIARKGNLRIDVMAVLNDTTGTLMSCAHRNPKCRVGVIIGTGANACYVENVKNIELLDDQHKNKPEIIINVEWGAFGERGALDFILTDYDKEIDKNSLNPSGQIFEKMLSGMYLGELVRLMMIKAIQNNHLFATNAKKFKLLDILTTAKDCFETRYLSEIETDISPNFNRTKRILEERFKVSNASVEDCQKLQFLCECVSKRSAYLVGIGTANLINRVEEKEVVVGVDGSVYRLHPKYETHIKEILRKFVTPDKKYELMLSEDGSGRGAALIAAVASHQKQNGSATPQ